MSFDKDKISILNKDITSWLWSRSEEDFRNNKNYNFTSVEDGNPIVETYNNFTILQETIVSVSNRCKGLYLNILGDLIIEGTLSMSARGASGIGTNIGIIPDIGIFYCNNKEYLINMGCLEKNIIPAVGGAMNTTGVNRQTGGRRHWPGALVVKMEELEHLELVFLADQVVGGASFENAGGAAELYAGRGGWGASGVNGIGGGGAGNPGGSGSAGAGANGTGGVIILNVFGNIKIGLTGKITANGTNGHAGGVVSGMLGGTGGGSGGRFY